MNKKELVSRLESLVTQYIEEFKVEAKHWEQRYYIAYQTNLKLEEQNKVLTQEKQALLDVVADWKSENQSLAALNETLSTESQNWQGQCAELRGQYSLVLKELAEKESSWSKAFAAAEERHEDFKKRSDGILATMGENLQRKQEQIEALTTWKEGTEKVLDSMEARVKEKQEKIDSLIGNNEILARTAYNLQAQLESLRKINSFQEHRIEVLSRKARKLRKKEQND